jgi:hypothetical protein
LPPEWYRAIAPALPRGFTHAAVVESNDLYVTIETISLDTPARIILTVTRHTYDPDPSGAITEAELPEAAIDLDKDLNVSLTDGRQVGIHCAVPADGEIGCSMIGDEAPSTNELRSLIRALAAMPVKILPPTDALEPTVDRTSLALSIAHDVTGLSASGGIEKRSLMILTVGGEDSPSAPLGIRAVADVIPALDPMSPNTRPIGNGLIAWSAMPDGSLWSVFARPPVDSAAPTEILDRLAGRLSGGTVPTLAPPITPPHTDPSDNTPSSANPPSPPGPSTAQEGQVLVANANGVAGSAGDLSAYLETLGFSVAGGVDAFEGVGVTQLTEIYYRDGFESLAQEVAGAIEASDPQPWAQGSPIIAPEDFGDAGVIVLLGLDLVGHSDPTVPTSSSSPDCEHVVTIGDNPDRVAAKYGVTVDELSFANADNPAYTRFLIGDVLNIPC